MRFELEGTGLELFAESRHGTRKDVPFPRQNAFIVAFLVEDIDAAYAELSVRDAYFPKGIGEAEWGRYAHFRDPQGNRLQLYQPRPGF